MQLYKNKVVIPKDNPVVYVFDFAGDFADEGLNNFSNIVFELEGETYSTNTHPSNVKIKSATTLEVNIGALTSVPPGEYDETITGYNVRYDDGFELVGAEVYPLNEQLKVV